MAVFSLKNTVYVLKFVNVNFRIGGYFKILQDKCGVQYQIELEELKKDTKGYKRTFESGNVSRKTFSYFYLN